ncbi:MAG TPA: hypothetical protein VJ870_18635 [Amycolatopsis sp.]|nr:hypothetical protein [Amycolatopsis sp.]
MPAQLFSFSIGDHADLYTAINGELQRLLRAENADHSTFYEVKSATSAYLEEFLTNLDVELSGAQVQLVLTLTWYVSGAA